MTQYQDQLAREQRESDEYRRDRNGYQSRGDYLWAQQRRADRVNKAQNKVLEEVRAKYRKRDNG